MLSDISRAIEDQLFPYCNRIMQILLENLQSNEVNRNVKPHIISAFGDIALAIGDKFEYYIQHVVSMLQSAQVTTVSWQHSCRLRVVRPGISHRGAFMFERQRALLRHVLTASECTCLGLHWICIA